MNHECNIPEEKIIDYVLGSLSSFEENKIRKHINQCDVCMEHYDHWRVTFADNTAQENIPKRVKRQVWKSILPERKKMFTRPVLGAAFVFTLMIAVLSTSTQDWVHPHKVQSKPFVPVEAVSHHENQAFKHLDSYVWYSPEQNKLAVYVKGLPSIGSNEYRAWLKNEHGLADAGMLKVNYNQDGELYYQGEELKNTEYILFTVEPSDNVHQPKGPEVFIIRLHPPN